MNNFESLVSLGWQTFFFQQLSLDEWEQLRPVRVVEQHRSLLSVVGEGFEADIAVRPAAPALTVGDWLLLASAFGWDGHYVDASRDLKAALRRAFDAPGPSGVTSACDPMDRTPQGPR